ncbi:MAG: PAS domain-containing sensor histidine kinase [Armatimonadota bacterium]
MAQNRFDAKIEETQHQLEALARQAEASPEERRLLTEALATLSTTLEELHVAGEELREQNDELLAAREVAREERERYQGLFEFAPDAYLQTDAGGVIEQANHAAVDLFGLPRELLIGKPLLFLIAPADQHALRELLLGVREGVARHEAELTIRTSEDRLIPVALTMAAIRNHDGTVQGMRWLLREITERRRLEEALREANSLLAQRVQEQTTELEVSDAAVARLHGEQEEQSIFVHTVSHDLRIPLTTIQGHAQLLTTLLEQTGVDGNARRSLETILRSVQRMNVMIEDLVDLARIEGGQLQLKLQPVALPSFLIDLLQRMSTTLETGRITLRMPADLPPVVADYARLERVVMNLLSNALKYSAPNSRVLVCAEHRENQVVVSIIDQGKGIPPEALSHLFERFYRAADRKAEGIGLGLYITKMLVEAQGGRIWAESEVERGSTFSFTLPIAQDCSDEETPAG